jgi:hypothetical protein
MRGEGGATGQTDEVIFLPEGRHGNDTNGAALKEKQVIQPAT